MQFPVSLLQARQSALQAWQGVLPLEKVLLVQAVQVPLAKPNPTWQVRQIPSVLEHVAHSELHAVQLV